MLFLCLDTTNRSEPLFTRPVGVRALADPLIELSESNDDEDEDDEDRAFPFHIVQRLISDSASRVLKVPADILPIGTSTRHFVYLRVDLFISRAQVSRRAQRQRACQSLRQGGAPDGYRLLPGLRVLQPAGAAGRKDVAAGECFSSVLIYFLDLRESRRSFETNQNQMSVPFSRCRSSSTTPPSTARWPLA